jgi:hypothetical protein
MFSSLRRRRDGGLLRPSARTIVGDHRRGDIGRVAHRSRTTGAAIRASRPASPATIRVEGACTRSGVAGDGRLDDKES